MTGLLLGENYIVVQTVTPANSNNQNTVTSLPSTEMLVGVGFNKSYPDGTSVEVQGVVTAAFADCFYVESPDRSWGIRVEPSMRSSTPGTVEVMGTMATKPSGERFVQASSASRTGPGALLPLGLKNAALGGGNCLYNAATGAGQCGVWGRKGLNNIGLLVRIWGKVTAAGPNWFYLDDGSGVVDGTGNTGVYVDTEGQSVPSVGEYVCVTGISSPRHVPWQCGQHTAGCERVEWRAIRTEPMGCSTIVRRRAFHFDPSRSTMNVNGKICSGRFAIWPVRHNLGISDARNDVVIRMVVMGHCKSLG